MKPSILREQRLYDALRRITKYMSPDELRRTSEMKYGLDGEEAIEMSYENVLNEARSAIKGLRRPEPPAPAPLVVEMMVLRVPAAPKGEAGEMEAAKGDATPLPTHPQQEKKS